MDPKTASVRHIHDSSDLNGFDNKTSVTGILPKLWKDHRDRLIAALAHEVRNPLSNINLSVELMDAMKPGKEQKLYLDIITRNSARISGLITELLQYQPVDEQPREKYSAYRLLEEVLEMAEDRLLLREISIRKEYAAEDCELTINVQKMKLALTNILINAIDSMTAKKRVLTLETQSIDSGYNISIGDTGCGISKDELNSIFKPYYTNKLGGLGLGLSTTYDILMSNDVGVSVESEEAIGTRFILQFTRAV